jgi:hypothetical protein
VAAQAQFGLSGTRDFSAPAEKQSPGKKEAAPVSFNLSDYKLQTNAWNPNEGYIHRAGMEGVRNNLYMLFYPLESMSDQLDSEIMPLRVQWAAAEGKSELDPHSDSWKRFKRLYGYQFGEQKTVGLLAPELSYSGETEQRKEMYNLGRYLRIVRLYVQPQFEDEFEDFVHHFIVPAAEQILTKKKNMKRLPPVEQRTYWQLPTYMRIVSINVNMPTIPEFELFIQQRLLGAARDTNTAMLTYRTVTGDKHNYHLMFPFTNNQEPQHDNNRLMVSRLMREHQLQLLANRAPKPAGLQPASYAPSPAATAAALAAADNLSAEFHGHAIHIEEIVQKIRPDMSASLPERYTKKSIEFVQSSFKQQ